jgi:hypothetical protein
MVTLFIHNEERCIRRRELGERNRMVVPGIFLGPVFGCSELPTVPPDHAVQWLDGSTSLLEGKGIWVRILLLCMAALSESGKERQKLYLPFMFILTRGSPIVLACSSISVVFGVIY